MQHILYKPNNYFIHKIVSNVFSEISYYFQVNRFYMEKMMEFSVIEIKKMFLKCPRIFVRSKFTFVISIV